MAELLRNGEFLSPKEVMQRINRTNNEQRLMAYAMEHLVFSHPYKKFSVKVDVFDPVVEGKPATGIVSKLEVYDFNANVCTLRFFMPSGESRTAPQLEFAFNYNVHHKDPKSVKRTSNPAKIKDCVMLIRPAQATDHFDKYDADMLIEREAKVSDIKDKADGFFRGMYYGKDLADRICFFDDLINGVKTSSVEVHINKFSELKVKWQEAMGVRNKLSRACVHVIKNHNRDYRAVYRLAKGERMKESEDFEFHMLDFDSKDKLSPEIFGKVALLEIAEHNDNPNHIVEGVGKMSKEVGGKVVSYILIGEDIVDPRAQGKNEGS